MTTTAKIPTRYTRSNDYDATTIVAGVPGVSGWVWTIHTKHSVLVQGIAATYGQATAAAKLAS